MAKRVEKRSGCPISFALDMFGDKWTLLVMRDLIFHGKRHYSELLASDEAISTNILAERLSRLEAAGIISKRVDPSSRRRFIYAVTSKGADLVPMLVEIVMWSARHDADSSVTPAFLRRARRDREGLVSDIQGALKKARSKGVSRSPAATGR